MLNFIYGITSAYKCLETLEIIKKNNFIRFLSLFMTRRGPEFENFHKYMQTERLKTITQFCNVSIELMKIVTTT